MKLVKLKAYKFKDESEDKAYVYFNPLCLNAIYVGETGVCVAMNAGDTFVDEKLEDVQKAFDDQLSGIGGSEDPEPEPEPEPEPDDDSEDSDDEFEDDEFEDFDDDN